ncbi:hypothetical protein M0811_00081 [Anaeramoeba ignava]|uniref:Fibronectin type-III domain-containing protein n=1 Tax=Anaeramoeba ignava TaxID=1746090 RepID=A0A9Q0RE42_ANAIG|nr:hypothetical protein M0811_00081 [Anaeramoeba ignava]
MKMKMKIVIIIFNIILALIQITEETKNTKSPVFQWELIDKLTPTTSSSNFGYNVVISEELAVVGDGGEDDAFIYQNNGSIFNMQKILDGSTSSYFGSSVSMFEKVVVVGSPYSNQVFIYRKNATDWNLESTLEGASGSQFGWSVAISGNVTVVGANLANQVSIYRYNGSDWDLECNLTQLSSTFGFSVAIYQDVIVVGSSDLANETTIYRYNGSDWNLESNLSENSEYFGSSVSVYGNFVVVGASDSNQAFIYQHNGSDWNLNKILNGSNSSTFGSSVSNSENVVVVGACNGNQARIYRYNGSDWHLELNLSENSSYFGYSVSISLDNTFVIVGAPYSNEAFIYKVVSPPQVNLTNCSSSFASFDCYWDYIDYPILLEYQINYGFGWEEIESPILKEENILYQQFNSSLYSNITGNYDYSIQIKACDPLSFECGNQSLAFNLTTKIDSIKNFQFIPTNDSMSLFWDHPDVPVTEGIPNLDHYVISFQNQSSQETTNISISNSSNSYILDDLECGTYYNISIWACRTLLCEGDDQGKITSFLTQTIFEQISSLKCIISNALLISCSWDSPSNCSSLPSYYNLTYQAISQDDPGNYQTNSTNKSITVDMPNQEYQINISACNSDYACGKSVSVSIKTGNLSAPEILEKITEVEEIELNFTKVLEAKNYAISIDNGTKWENFSNIESNENQVIGEFTHLSGNVEYQISIRACADLSCETGYLGLISTTIPVKVKLGNITSFNCKAIKCGFECTWNPLNLSTGLSAYSLAYNSTSVCIPKSITNYSSLHLYGGQIYQISIFASASENCSFNQYSGIPTSILIKTLLPPTESTDDDPSTTIIVISSVVPLFVIGFAIVIFVFLKKFRNRFRQAKIEKESEGNGIGNDLDI